jgi:DNA-binding response OmpR family regulator
MNKTPFSDASFRDGLRARGTATILVVDDDGSVRESLGAVLREEGYGVRLAESGRAGIRQLLEGPVDLVLLDLNMPDTNGWEAFEVMSRLAPQVPVIVITARPCQTRRAAESGVDMLLEKPLQIPVLLETIRYLLAAPEAFGFARILRAWRSDGPPTVPEK